MNLWKYYDGDLKYPDLTKYLPKNEMAKYSLKWAYEYLQEHNDDDLEKIIAKNAHYAFYYASYVLNGQPFPLGEPAIAKDEYYSKEYTKYVLKKDFILDGKLICKYEG